MRYFPNLFHFISSVRFPKTAASKKNDIIIDGYMRSSNTFSYYAFKYLNKKASISHHRHSSAGILFGIRHNIPVLLLIRRPSDVFLSTYIFKNQDISFNEIAESWLRFYEIFIPYKYKICIGDFNSVTSDFSNIVQKINFHYKKDFNYHTEENFNNLIFNNIQDWHNDFHKQTLNDRIAVPNTKRLEKKLFFTNKMKNEIPDLLAKADNLYKELIS